MGKFDCKHVGILGGIDCHKTKAQDELTLYKITHQDDSKPTIIISNPTNMPQDEFFIKLENVYETHFQGNKIKIELVKQNVENTPVVDVKKALDNIQEDYNAKRIVDDMYKYSTITQNNHQPFYATLRPSKHKKTNKKKRK